MTRRAGVIAALATFAATASEKQFQPNHCPVCDYDCGPAPRLEPFPELDPGGKSYVQFPEMEEWEKRRAKALAADKAYHGDVDITICPKCMAAFGRKVLEVAA